MRRVIGITASLLIANVSWAQVSEDTEGETDSAEGGSNSDEVEVSAQDQVAREIFVDGREAYNAGRYEDALDAFLRAHRLSGRDALYYNIALAHDRLRHDQEALDAYERYLAEVETSSSHDEVRARVRALRRVLAEEEAEDEASSRRVRRVAIITTLVAVVLGAAAFTIWAVTRPPELEPSDLGQESVALIRW